MACGTAVVASSHPSLDEASGEIAFRADPESAETFADEVERALSGGPPSQDGLEHARRFTPRACAEAVLAGYAAAS
jgi:hypothetical protein